MGDPAATDWKIELWAGPVDGEELLWNVALGQELPCEYYTQPLTKSPERRAIYRLAGACHPGRHARYDYAGEVSFAG